MLVNMITSGRFWVIQEIYKNVVLWKSDKFKFAPVCSNDLRWFYSIFDSS